MLHFEGLLSGDDLLAIWSLEPLQLHQLMILSQYQNFADFKYLPDNFFSKLDRVTNMKKRWRTKFLEKQTATKAQ